MGGAAASSSAAAATKKEMKIASTAFKKNTSKINTLLKKICKLDPGTAHGVAASTAQLLESVLHECTAQQQQDMDGGVDSTVATSLRNFAAQQQSNEGKCTVYKYAQYARTIVPPTRFKLRT